MKNAAVYYLRMIMHDWSDNYCVTILKHLREAASPDSKLLIVDDIMEFSCKDSDMTFATLPGRTEACPPYPLLPNNGHGNAIKYITDLQVSCFILQFTSMK